MKGKRFYKKLVALTFIIPMLGLMGYFFVSSNVGVQILLEAPHVVLEGVSKEYDFIVDPENYISIDNNSLTVTVTYPNFEYNDTTVNGSITFEISELMYFQAHYYKVTEGQLEQVNITGIVKESLFVSKFTAGLAIFMVLGISAIISLIVFKKMELYKKYKRASVLITSLTITIIFLMLSAITTQIFLIFGTFSLCWFIYYIEWIIYRKRNGMSLSEYTPERVVITNG